MVVTLNIDAYFLGIKDEDYREIPFETSGRTVGECLDQFLAGRTDIRKGFFGENGALDPMVAIFVNNTPVARNPLRRVLKNGDVVRVMFVRQGG